MLKLNIKLEGRNRDYGRAIVQVDGFKMNEKEFNILRSVFRSLFDSTDVYAYKLSWECTFKDTSIPTEDGENTYAVIVLGNNKYTVRLYFFPWVVKEAEKVVIRFVLREEDSLFVLLRLLELVEGVKVAKQGEWELFLKRG